MSCAVRMSFTINWTCNYLHVSLLAWNLTSSITAIRSRRSRRRRCCCCWRRGRRQTWVKNCCVRMILLLFQGSCSLPQQLWHRFRHGEVPAVSDMYHTVYATNTNFTLSSCLSCSSVEYAHLPYRISCVAQSVRLGAHEEQRPLTSLSCAAWDCKFK